MTYKGITWLEVDEKASILPGIEGLEYRTILNSRRPPEEPWSAFVTPTQSGAIRYYQVYIGPGGRHRFLPGIVDAFSAIARALCSTYSNEEKKQIANDQMSRGNAEVMWSASQTGLLIHTPDRLIAELKEQVESMFRRAEAVVREITEQEILADD
jgi:hypothetical protein